MQYAQKGGLMNKLEIVKGEKVVLNGMVIEGVTAYTVDADVQAMPTVTITLLVNDLDIKHSTEVGVATEWLLK